MAITAPVVATAAGYFAGSIPSADIANRLARRGVGDLRTAGSGNPGALNTATVLGTRWGVAVLIADMAKGVAAGLLGRAIAGPVGAYAAALHHHHLGPRSQADRSDLPQPLPRLDGARRHLPRRAASRVRLMAARAVAVLARRHDLQPSAPPTQLTGANPNANTAAGGAVTSTCPQTGQVDNRSLRVAPERSTEPCSNSSSPRPAWSTDRHRSERSRSCRTMAPIPGVIRAVGVRPSLSGGARR